MKWLGVLVLVVLAGWISIIRIVNSCDDLIFNSASEAGHAPVAIIFGAAVYKFGPSPELRSRLDGGISLYREGKVSKLLMSGDNSTWGYNEPEAMRRYALKQGIPNEDIVLDYAGRDTYDTCYRALHVFGVKKAILVTQQYHAPRAVFIGQSLGLISTCYAVPNLDQYPYLQAMHSAREYLADIKALWDVRISHRLPYIDQNRQQGGDIAIGRT